MMSGLAQQLLLQPQDSQLDGPWRGLHSQSYLQACLHTLRHGSSCTSGYPDVGVHSAERRFNAFPCTQSTDSFSGMTGQGIPCCEGAVHVLEQSTELYRRAAPLRHCLWRSARPDQRARPARAAQPPAPGTAAAAAVRRTSCSQMLLRGAPCPCWLLQCCPSEL